MYKLPTQKLIMLRIITAVIVFFTLISSVVTSFFVVYIRTYVKGESMLPTLNVSYSQTGEQDIIYVNRFAKTKVNDIVVLDLRSHNTFGNYAVKRLIALEGDVVNITVDDIKKEYYLTVNGTVVETKAKPDLGYKTYGCLQNYISNHQADSSRISKNEYGEIEGVIVKQGEVFVLGDNWEVSKDSSLVGPLPTKSVVGRVDFVIKPSQNEFFTILKQIF